MDGSDQESLERTRRASRTDARNRSSRSGLTQATLGMLAFAAGTTDALTYIALGHVFTANMTGNTVLLGIAVVSGDGARIARSGAALAGFCLGVALAARVVGRDGERAAIALGGEALVLAMLAILAAIAGAHPATYPLIAMSGTAMGMQSGVVRASTPPGVATTYITGTLTALISSLTTDRRDHHADRSGPADDDAGSGRADGSPPRAANRLRAAIWITYLAAALSGAAASRAWEVQASWIAVATVSAVAIIVSRLPATGPQSGRPGSASARRSC